MRRFLVFAVMMTVAGSLSAQTRPAMPGVPAKRIGTVDPRFEAVRQVLEAHGPTVPYFGPHGLPAGTRVDGVSAMLRFSHRLDALALVALERSGVEWQRGADGQIVRIGNVYGAFVRFESLTTLASSPMLVYAEVAWHPVTVRPLGVTGREVGAIAARTMPTLQATGSGAVIGDVDSGVDVLHPHMFRADGGAFAWLDTDGDGRFTPGQDHIDYDRDGEGDFNEVARVLDASEYGPADALENDDDVLDVARDWIYVDANEDLERNAGREAGFTEFDPGYGEPTFVPDDADRSGVLDIDERVLLLSTSKVSRFVTSQRTYVRGDDLIDAENVSFKNQFLHGTGVASILVGGHPARARAGVAPDADLVMYAAHMDAQGNGFEEAAQLSSISDAAQTGVDVLVHEWTNPYTAPMDGAGNLEEAMLNARASGVLQVNPLGNMNLSEKHAELDVQAGVVAEMQFEVGAGFDGGTLPYSAIYGSLYWRGDHEPTFTLRNPTGVAVPLQTDGSIVEIGPDHFQGTLSTSLRGTRQLLLIVWNADSSVNVDEGTWTIEVDSTASDLIVGRIADAWSGWSLGVRWLDPVQGHNTAVYPATADAAFGIAAYGGRHEMPTDGTSAGELRNYSGRGPRIDGARLVDLAAPDDPFAAWGVSEGWIESGAGRSWFLTFGGTSGAAPHVAGAVALMRAADPSITPIDMEQRLLDTARRDDETPTTLPDAAWGEGKLDVFHAVLGTPLAPSDPVVASVEVDGDELTAEGSTGNRFRWDLDYDGTWDTDWVWEPRIALPDAEPRVVRLEVHDGLGSAGGAVLRVRAASPMEPSDMRDVGVETPDLGGELPEPLPLAPSPTCGCSSASEAGSSTLLFLVALLGLRRRRWDGGVPGVPRRPGRVAPRPAAPPVIAG